MEYSIGQELIHRTSKKVCTIVNIDRKTSPHGFILYRLALSNGESYWEDSDYIERTYSPNIKLHKIIYGI